VGQIFVDLFVSVPALMLGCGHKVHLASKQSLNSCYEGRSKSFATQFDAQMTQAKFWCNYST